MGTGANGDGNLAKCLEIAYNELATHPEGSSYTYGRFMLWK